MTEFRIGVILITGNGSPYDVKRSGAAVTLAVREVNSQVLNDSYRIVPIMRTYGPKCDANKAPGMLCCVVQLEISTQRLADAEERSDLNTFPSFG